MAYTELQGPMFVLVGSEKAQRTAVCRGLRKRRKRQGRRSFSSQVCCGKYLTIPGSRSGRNAAPAAYSRSTLKALVTL